MKKSFFVLFMCLLCSSQVAVNAQSSQKTDALMVRDTSCLLYTSDAADDLLCVDFGGCGIIKKKKTRIQIRQRRRCINKKEKRYDQ